jgi:hypothetical protein
MIDDGEISHAVAVRILEDLFEIGGSGESPSLRWSVWSAYVEERGTSSFREQLTRLGKPEEPSRSERHLH